MGGDTTIFLQCPAGITLYEGHPVVEAWQTILKHGGREIRLRKIEFEDHVMYVEVTE